MSEMLKIEDLWVSVGSREVLKGVNFSMDYGEINVLFGPNGAGKTSFMMTLMGFPRYKVEQGKIYFKGEEYAKAVRSFEELMKMRNEVVAERAWYRGGEIYRAMGETTRALEAFRTYVSLYPNSEQAADAWLAIGDIHYRERRFTQAVAAYERVLGSKGRDQRARAQLAIGRSYRGLNDDEASLTALMKVYYLYPDQKGAVAAALIEAGEIYFAQRRTGEAAQVYRKVLDLAPDRKEADKAREMLKKIDAESRTVGAHTE